MKTQSQKIAALTLGLSFCFNTFAQSPKFNEGGQGVGNGGGAVVCFNQPITSQGLPIAGNPLPLKIVNANVLDYWEWKQKTGVKLDMGPPTLSFQEKFAVVARRLAPVDPFLSNYLMKQYNEHFPDIHFSTEAEVPEINDAFTNLGYGTNCYKKQIARQKHTGLRDLEKKILIDGKLFAKLQSNDDRAGLILHEYLYWIAIESGAVDSDNTRYFNFLISSERKPYLDAKYYTTSLNFDLTFNSQKMVQFYNERRTELEQIGFKAAIATIDSHDAGFVHFETPTHFNIHTPEVGASFDADQIEFNAGNTLTAATIRNFTGTYRLERRISNGNLAIITLTHKAGKICTLISMLNSSYDFPKFDDETCESKIEIRDHSGKPVDLIGYESGGSTHFFPGRDFTQYLYSYWLGKVKVDRNFPCEALIYARDFTNLTVNHAIDDGYQISSIQNCKAEFTSSAELNSFNRDPNPIYIKGQIERAGGDSGPSEVYQYVTANHVRVTQVNHPENFLETNCRIQSNNIQSDFFRETNFKNAIQKLLKDPTCTLKDVRLERFGIPIVGSFWAWSVDNFASPGPALGAGIDLAHPNAEILSFPKLGKVILESFYKLERHHDFAASKVYREGNELVLEINYLNDAVIRFEKPNGQIERIHAETGRPALRFPIDSILD